MRLPLIGLKDRPYLNSLKILLKKSFTLVTNWLKPVPALSSWGVQRR